MRKKMKRSKAVAKKHPTSRDDIDRQLDRLLEGEKPGPGVGWKEHFEWLRKHGRSVDGNIADELRDGSESWI
jgi:hypothetical protein